LPDIAHENITRYLSAQPKSRDWPRFIAGEDLASTFQIDGYFGKFVSSRFVSICISKRPPWSLPGKSEDWIYVRNQDHAFQILMQGGENIKAMYIDGWFAAKLLDSKQVPAIAEKCINLESFIIKGRNVVRWLEKCGN